MAMCFKSSVKQHPIAKNEVHAYLFMGYRPYCRPLFIYIIQPAKLQSGLVFTPVCSWPVIKIRYIPTRFFFQSLH